MLKAQPHTIRLRIGGIYQMKKPALLVPVLLVLAATAQEQNPAACPQLPADAELTWEHRGSAGSDFCRALRADGSEAFGVYIARDSPFTPKRGNRDVEGMLDGREIYWYRAEIALKPDVKALETLLELNDGRLAHVWLQSTSDEQLQQVMGITRDLRFIPVRRDAQVAGGQ